MVDLSPSETKNLDRYGNDAMPWSRVHEQLAGEAAAKESLFILGTSRPDCRPHAANVGAAWYDGDLYFTSGPGTRKSRNLAENPACTFFTRLPGVDLTLEGEASRVTDAETLAALAAIYRDGGWPAEVAGDALEAPYSAQSAGPPPWYLYRFTFHTAFGVATEEPYSASRWRFDR